MDEKSFKQLLDSLTKSDFNQRRRRPSKIKFEQAKQVFNKIAKVKFPEFQYDEFNKEVVRNLILYFIGNQETEYDLFKGIMLYGAYGRGKTAILSIFEVFCTVLKIDINFELVLTRRIVMEAHKNKDLSILDKYCLQPKCFDDVGREEKAIEVYRNAISPFEYMIDVCYFNFQQKGRFYHITTNYDFDEIEKFYGKRAKTLAIEMFNPVLLSGPNRRK